MFMLICLIILEELLWYINSHVGIYSLLCVKNIFEDHLSQFADGFALADTLSIWRQYVLIPLSQCHYSFLSLKPGNSWVIQAILDILMYFYDVYLSFQIHQQNSLPRLKPLIVQLLFKRYVNCSIVEHIQFSVMSRKVFCFPFTS